MGGCVASTPVHAMVSTLGCSMVPQVTSVGGTGASRTLPFQCCFAISICSLLSVIIGYCITERAVCQVPAGIFGQYRTKSVWRLCRHSSLTSSAKPCIIQVAFEQHRLMPCCLRACVHRHLPASFRQILLHTALKILARHQVCLRIFALPATKFARKSAHISYEHKL